MTVVRRDQQSGAVLIVALVFMLILAIIGGASMQNATLQERMAGNSKDLNIAFQAAEIAIRGAEEVMKTVK
ncbi:PilX N-terminal domain-containing pilus assembly protein, partial [Spongiibacter sp.]|uniref:pilus assembly PilX family protein n=1 Tax=Spongiibacter sp. TaxID=2024860 RepID=UPI0035633708